MARNLKLLLIVLSVFTLVGIGLGLSGWIIIDAAGNQFISEDAGEIANSIGQMLILILLMAGIMMTFFTGPTVGAITGLHVGSNSPDRGFAIGAAAVGSFIGFLIMASIAILIMVMALPEMGGGGGSGGGSGGGLELADYITKVIIVALPTTVVGGISAWFGFES